jgi:hypothetical protein
MIKRNYLLVGGEIFRRSIFWSMLRYVLTKESRVGLERLMHYCARLVFASERLTWLRDGEQLSYELPNGCQVLHLTQAAV